ncbi:MAG: TatD family hydrolase [Patescibacteria group bacterium]
MLFDSHAHPHFSAYQNDSDEVIRRALDADVGMLLVGTQQDTSAAAVAVAERYNNVWAAIGLHPIHTTDGYFDPNEETSAELIGGTFKRRAETFDATSYRALAASSKKVVAIGEVGLDYYRLEGDMATQACIKETQRRVFAEQIALAAELNLPLAIHCRDAHGDVFAMLRDAQAKNPKVRGVIHCFTGTPAEAEQHRSLGFLISFSGIVTFAREWDEYIRSLPLDAFLVETDSPYLAPKPYRGKRNEPRYVAETVAHIASLRGELVEVVANATTQNAEKLFGVRLAAL